MRAGFDVPVGAATLPWLMPPWAAVPSASCFPICVLRLRGQTRPNEDSANSAPTCQGPAVAVSSGGPQAHVQPARVVARMGG